MQSVLQCNFQKLYFTTVWVLHLWLSPALLATCDVKLLYHLHLMKHWLAEQCTTPYNQSELFSRHWFDHISQEICDKLVILACYISNSWFFFYTLEVTRTLTDRLTMTMTNESSSQCNTAAKDDVLLQQTTVLSPEATAWYILMLPREVPVHGKITT